MAGLMGFGLFRVHGHSMAPGLLPGDYLLTRPYWPWQQPQPGDQVVYAAPQGGLLIKTVTALWADNTVSVRGDSGLSAPQVDLGQVPVAAIIGKVWTVIRQSSTAPDGPRSLTQ